MVISRLIGRMNALGNIRLVTRTWVLRSLICRSVTIRKPKSVGSTSIVGRNEAVEMRERRRLAKPLPDRPHIGEQNAAPLDHRIGLLPDVGAKVGAIRFGRGLQALSSRVEQPAVEGAAQ